MSAKKGPFSFLEAKTDPDMLIPGAPYDFNFEIAETFADMSQKLIFKWKKPLINSERVIKYRLFFEHLNYGSKSQKLVDKPEMGDSYQFFPSFKDVDDYDDYEENFDAQSSNKLPKKFVDIDSDKSFYEFSLDDLLKYSTYKFCLVAMDSNLSENEELLENVINNNSAELFVETPSDVPDGAPENLQVETLNTTSILIQWNMPETEKRNGLIVGYKIAVKEIDREVWDSSVDSEPRRKVIAGLLPGHKYSVRITARTVNGSGPASEWFIAETFLHEMDGRI